MAKLNNPRNAMVISLFSIAIFSIYAPALYNSFIFNYDDQAYVTGNPSVKAGLTHSGAMWAFTAVHSYHEISFWNQQQDHNHLYT